MASGYIDILSLQGIWLSKSAGVPLDLFDAQIEATQPNRQLKVTQANRQIEITQPDRQIKVIR